MENKSKPQAEEKFRFRKSKVLRIVVCGLVAFCLWFFVISEVRTEIEKTYRNVAVEFEGQSILADRGLKMISDTDLTVDLKLNGRRSVLNSLRSSDITVVVDLGRIYEAGSRSLSYEIQYPGDVITSDIEVVSRTPDTITITVVSWAEKRVDVREPQITGTPAEGYRVGLLSTDDWDPKKIKVAGPKEIIDQIQSAGVVVDVQGVSESQEVRKSFIYYDADGNPLTDTESIKAEPEKAQVRVPILKEKTVGLELPISVDSRAENTEFTLNAVVTLADGTQSSVTGAIMFEDGVATPAGEAVRLGEDGKVYLELGNITVFGSPISVEYVTEGSLPELLLYNQNEVAYTLGDVDLRQDGISCNVEQVQVTITTREKATKTFTGVRIRNINPLHYCSTSSLTVTIKGFPEDLEKVTKANIEAILEVEVTKTGEYDVVVTVQGHPNVTVVGNYPVQIEVPRVRPTAAQL